MALLALAIISIFYLVVSLIQSEDPNKIFAFFEALKQCFSTFASAFAILLSGKIAMQTLINNRFYELHKAFYANDLIECRRAVDASKFINDKIKLDGIYKNITQGGRDKKLSDEEELEIRDYYLILRFATFLDATCIAYRTGLLPKYQFIRTFGINVIAYSKKLETFIEHRQENKQGYKWIIDKYHFDFRKHIYDDLIQVSIHLQSDLNNKKWKKIFDIKD